MQFFSSQPLSVQMIPQTFRKQVTGEWLESSGGGSHLNDCRFDKRVGTTKTPLNWTKNPKFLVTWISDASSSQVSLKITLNRNEREWRGKVAKNTVGCMIGFYVFPVPPDALMNETE